MRMKRSVSIVIFVLFSSQLVAQEPFLTVLGTVQDAGSPHIACDKDCCLSQMDNPAQERMVVSLGLVDPGAQKRYLFEATPDMPRQLYLLNEIAPYGDSKTADGIFLTHAHIGHYTGLMYLGKEAMNSARLPVYAMPRMASYLRTNGPWSQLVALNNISLKILDDSKAISLSTKLTVKPITVPHRDEFSETVGYLIDGPAKSALFIPDIDKWNKWDDRILDWIKKTDYVFVDGSFFDQEEIDYRDISEIPHPFISESMELFDDLSPNEKSRVYFIHFNHTNPVLKEGSSARQKVLDAGYKIALTGDRISL